MSVDAGRVRRLYVLPSHRRRGVARGLVSTVIERARSHFELLVVRTYDETALSFYAALGFETVDEDVSDWFVGFALALAFMTSLLSLAWFQRLP